MIYLADVKVQVFARQDDIPVRGNAIASGDARIDADVENNILHRLEDGDVWAWASVEVRVTHEASGLSGSDYLDGCSYESEEDFRESEYFYDMTCAALDALNAGAGHIFDALKPHFG